jgi:ribonuclease VapC
MTFVDASAILAILKREAEAAVSITQEDAQAALVAFARYGKGRSHPARLNMGDCFAYAAARTRGMPLLYKGNDFTRTDIEPAVP